MINYRGTVGKRPSPRNLLAPRISEARIYAVETINETAGDLGLDIQHPTKVIKFGKLYKELLMAENAIIDALAPPMWKEFIDR